MKFSNTWWKDLREAVGTRHEPERVHVLADLYWRALLICAFSVLVVVFLYGIWGLSKILNGLGAALDTSAPPPAALDRPTLNATLQAFETRKSQFEELKTNPPTSITDPSR